MARDAYFDNVERRLTAWGEWARGRVDRVGWNPVTPLGRVIEFGMQGAAQPRARIDCTDAVAEVEDVLRHAPEAFREALTAAYATRRDYPTEVIARGFGMSRPAFCALLKVSEAFVLGGLTERAYAAEALEHDERTARAG